MFRHRFLRRSLLAPGPPAGPNVLVHIAAISHGGHTLAPLLLKAQLFIEVDGLNVVSEHLQLHPDQHEPIVGQIQHRLHQRGTHALPLPVGVDKNAHVGRVAHPKLGPHLKPHHTDNRAVRGHSHKIVVVGPQRRDAVLVALDPL